MGSSEEKKRGRAKKSESFGDRVKDGGSQLLLSVLRGAIDAWKILHRHRPDEMRGQQSRGQCGAKTGLSREADFIGNAVVE